MNKEFTWKDWNNSVSWNTQLQTQLQFNDWNLPDDFIFFTLKHWIEYSGANDYETLEEAKQALLTY